MSSVVLLAVVFDAIVINSSESVTAVYGDNVTLFCTVLALGSNVSVIWSSSTTISLPDSTTTPTGKNEYNGTLTLSNVTQELTGNYTCRVENDFEEDMEDIDLIVQGTVCDVLLVLEFYIKRNS